MKEQPIEDHKSDSPAGCLLRLSWMMIGNLVLLFCAYCIAQHDSGFLSVADVFYWAAVGGLLLVRYIDIRHLSGLTAYGDPASMVHWRRYAASLAVVSAGLWLAAHAMARFGA